MATPNPPGGMTAVAAEITMWQGAALSLPLPDVQAVATSLSNHLTCVLNDFNDAYTTYANGDNGNSGEPAPELDAAVVEVVRQATAAAVFTLAARQRTHKAAKAN